MSVYTLKGFVSIANLISNLPNTNSAIGELSIQSLTYTKDKGEYENVAVPGYRLIGISSNDSVAGAVPVEITVANKSIEITKFILEYLRGKILPIDKTVLYTEIMDEFFDQITDLVIGDIVSSGIERMPEWISYKHTGVNNKFVKLWFADAAFAQQYDEYSITVIPPLTNIDDFFLAPSIVTTKLAARTRQESTDLIQQAKGVPPAPETVIRTETYDYVSPITPHPKTATSWDLLIYGLAGDNSDAIKEAIIKYIEANSTRTPAQWAEILPDIFKTTEFVIFPRWDLFAIPNTTVQYRGIYSPTANISETINFVNSTLTQWDMAEVETSISVLPHHWNSISSIFIGSPDNKSGAETIEALYPDYANLSTSSLDFNRMSEDTKNFSLTFQRALMEAETATEFTPVPAEFRRVTRDGKIYIVFKLNNINFLVYCKNNA